MKPPYQQQVFKQMKLIKHSLAGIVLMAGAMSAFSGAAAGKTDNQVLATVGKEAVTAADLKKAIASSPYATQFNTLNEDAQAELRGDFLKRLVAFRLFGLEAKAQGLDKDPAYVKEERDYKLAQYYRFYTQKLRDQIKLPADVERRLQAQYKGQADALTAARAAEKVNRYRELKLLTLRMLRERMHVKVHEDRFNSKAKPDTVLLEGDNGIVIRYGDLLDGEANRPAKPTREWIEDRIYKHAEFLLFAKAAEKEGVDIRQQMAAFRRERLPAMLMEKLEKQWAPDEKTLKDYYNKHPGLSYVPARWHVGQLVVSTYAQAAAMRKRILAGESLFRLAGRYSIDPYGRSHNGDMGWLQEGQGNPKIEAQLKKIADGEVSEIVKSAKGYHLVTVLARRPAMRRTYASMKDRVREAIIQQKYAAYLARLQKKYPVEWKVLANAREAKKGG